MAKKTDKFRFLFKNMVQKKTHKQGNHGRCNSSYNTPINTHSISSCFQMVRDQF